MARKAIKKASAGEQVDPQLDKLSIKELIDLQARIDAMLQARKDDEKAVLKAQFKQMAEEAGFVLADIVGGPRVGRPRGSVQAKFVNPENPSLTWSGRGRMPKWLSEKVKAGVDPETFRVSR